MAGKPGIPFSSEAEVAIEPLTGPDNDLWGGVIEFGAVAFRFYFGVPEQSAIQFQRRPLGLFVTREADNTQKVLALPWDDGGSNPFVLTRIADGTAERRPSAL